MSDMKCPFCNRNLHKGEDGIYSHLDYMTECKGRLFDGSKELWQELIKLMEDKDLSDKIGKLKTELDRTRKALDYCIERFKSLENVLDEKAEASDIPDNPDLYAWAVRIKTIWSELKEITGTDYKAEHK